MLLIPLTSTNTADILAQVTSIVSDLMPLIVIVMGIAIGLWVIGALLHLKQ